MKPPEQRIQEYFSFLFGREKTTALWRELEAMLEDFQTRLSSRPRAAKPDWLSESDAVLITYADQFRSAGMNPAQALIRFTVERLGDSISTVHLLPFFPFSSDDGFSVIDYYQVKPETGDWPDIRELGSRYRLAFDAVINHISRKSAWFEAFLAGEQPYADFFITADPGEDLSLVVRPRTLPLLTPVATKSGVKHVWTTFSPDQIDLNFGNPEVLMEMTRLLLFYVQQGASIIRLDAIAFLWKSIGTTCLHLPQTHTVVKFWRAVLDLAAPDVLLLTETNVPHAENISYFGSDRDEAQMVYQFPLAPLVLHSFLSGDTTRLREWAAGLENPPGNGTFFNFIASHDGIGVRPVEGILNAAEIQALVDRTLQHGGQASYKNNPDGSQSIYELNITLFDFLNDPEEQDHRVDIRRFMASQAIMLSLAGVPGIYIHSFFGARNCHRCMEETGRARSLNREKYDLKTLETALHDPASAAARVMRRYKQLLDIRKRQKAFHPHANQSVISTEPSVFALLRGQSREEILCLIHVAGGKTTVDLKLDHPIWADLMTGETFNRSAGEAVSIPLNGFQHRWLKQA